MSTAINSNLATLPASGPPPKSRVRDASSALSLVYDLIQGAQERNRKQALLQGMLGLNPPYSSAALRNSGQAYRSNFPSGEGKSIALSAMTPFYDLFASGRSYAEVKLDVPGGQGESTLNRVISDEFDKRLKEDKQVQCQFWKLIYDFVCYGRGHIIWEDQSDWHFKQVPLANVLYPDATDVDSRLWDYFCIRQEVPVSWLWERIKGEKAATARGWNIDAAREAIRGAVPDDPERGWTDYLRVQQELQDNDLYVSSRASKIKLANLFVKEFNGSWTHIIVCENFLQGRVSSVPTNQLEAASAANSSGIPAINEGTGFLFKQVSAFKEISSYLNNYYLDVTTGSINGLTGLAHDIYAFVMVKDRMLNTMADNTFFRGALILQAQTADALQRASVTLIGNTVIIPPNVSVQSSQVIGDVETSLGVIRDFDARVQNNTGVYRPQIVKPAGNPRTATEAELNYSQAATLTTSAVNRFYDQLDCTWDETFKRMLKGDAEFKKRLKERNIDLAVFERPYCVKAVRVIGAGSVAERRQAIGSLMSFYQQYPANGQRALLADVTAAFTDQNKVEEYMPANDMAELPSRHHWEATQENAALNEGSPVIWTPEQNDLIHIQVHLGAAMQGLQSASPQTDLPKLAAFCDGVAAHVSATHLPRLAASNPDAAKVMKKTLQAVIQGSQKVKQAIQQQMQQQQAEQQRAQQLSLDQQLDVQQAQHKMQMAEAKVQHSAQLKAAQADAKNRLSAFDLSASIERDNAATSAAIQQDTALTSTEIQLATAKTAADIRLSEAKAKAAANKPKSNGKS